MPVAQVTEGISKGVIDEVTKYHMEGAANQPGFTQTPMAILMNKARYDGLSPDLKAVIDKNSGLAMAATGACAGFGAICGSSLATAATMGQVALPELRAHGYSGRLATGTLAAAGTLGIMIPPSVRRRAACWPSSRAACAGRASARA